MSLCKMRLCYPKSRMIRRILSHRSASSLSAATSMLSSHQAPLIRHQLLDGNQLQKLALTLHHTHIHDQDITKHAPRDGTPVPPGHHLVYFTPDGTEDHLGPDGTDLTFHPPAPFTRRMWAGGRMTFNSPLVTGDTVCETTRLRNAVPKVSRSGADMILVEVEKEFRDSSGAVALVDERSWIFRPEIDAHATARIAPRDVKRAPTTIMDVVTKEWPARRFTWSAVGLFRFSALTFNGHKIHYDEGWSQAVEGHPAIVVHGPLNLINILDYWRHVHSQRRLQSITYRALAPLYAGDTYYIKTLAVVDEEGGERMYDIAAEKDGVVCMKAQVTAI